MTLNTLAWLGPEEAEEAFETLRQKAPARELRELAERYPEMPEWIRDAVRATADSANES